MPDTIVIRKGLDLPISGAAEKCVVDKRDIVLYAVKPTDFVGLTPRLLVAEGDAVKVGDALFCDKNDERIRFTSPVSGSVKAIVRGEKRRILEVVVEKGEESLEPSENFEIAENSESADDVKNTMLSCGLWTALRQRPFGTVANPDDEPKAIFVSAFSSAPLAPDYDFVMQGREEFFKKGLESLTKLTNGKVHVCFEHETLVGVMRDLAQLPTANCQLQTHIVKGPHPAGNIGTQIAHIDPINKGDVVWTMNVQDVAVLGELVSTGVYNPEKIIAVAGPNAVNPQYYKVKAGACIKDFEFKENSRIISGNVLSGNKIEPDGFVGAYDDLISVIPEGDYYDFMGWLMPGVKKFSFSRTFLSGFLPKLLTWKFDTNTHGDVRPLVFTGDFEKVFPFDIYPVQLIKACVIGDIELMENLGIYEVEPEDFALCEFIDVSKTDIQVIIREALEKLRKEGVL